MPHFITDSISLISSMSTWEIILITGIFLAVCFMIRGLIDFLFASAFIILVAIFTFLWIGIFWLYKKLKMVKI